MKLIESETRYPGAPLIDDHGLELPPEAAEDLRAFVTVPMGARKAEPEGEGGGQGQGHPTDVHSDSLVGAGGLQGVSSRPSFEPPRRFPPVLDLPDVHRIATLMMPVATANEALDVYFRYILSGYDRGYAFQRAFIYAAEAEGYHRGPR